MIKKWLFFDQTDDGFHPKYTKTWSIKRWGIFNKSVCHIHIFLFAGEFAASDVGFIWAPAGFLNLNVLFVSLCCVVLDWTSQGYVNWLSAGSLVLFSERDHFQRGGKKRRKEKKKDFQLPFQAAFFLWVTFSSLYFSSQICKNIFLSKHKRFSESVHFFVDELVYC